MTNTMKGLEIKYSCSSKPTKDTIKTCDEGFKGLQDSLVIVAKHINPLGVPIVWLLTRFYKREVTDTYISYRLPFIK